MIFLRAKLQAARPRSGRASDSHGRSSESLVDNEAVVVALALRWASGGPSDGSLAEAVSSRAPPRPESGSPKILSHSVRAATPASTVGWGATRFLGLRARRSASTSSSSLDSAGGGCVKAAGAGAGAGAATSSSSDESRSRTSPRPRRGSAACPSRSSAPARPGASAPTSRAAARRRTRASPSRGRAPPPRRRHTGSRASRRRRT